MRTDGGLLCLAAVETSAQAWGCYRRDLVKNLAVVETVIRVRSAVPPACYRRNRCRS